MNKNIMAAITQAKPTKCMLKKQPIKPVAVMADITNVVRSQVDTMFESVFSSMAAQLLCGKTVVTIGDGGLVIFCRSLTLKVPT